MRTAILGIHRQGVPAELSAIFTELGVDPDASEAEQLLEAVALLDRLERGTTGKPALTLTPPPQPEETPSYPTPRLARALELTLAEAYRPALPEVLDRFRKSGWTVPPRLLPEMLQLALAAAKSGHDDFAESLLSGAGERGRWLADLHPEWRDLLPPSDWAAAYRKCVMPSQRAALLRRWRRVDPHAARAALDREWDGLKPTQQESLLPALRVNLSPADAPFLERARGPRRKGVRHVATKILLSSGEPASMKYAQEKIREWTKDDGNRFQLEVPKVDLPTLEAWGAGRKEEPLPYLLGLLPPGVWTEQSEQSPLAFIQRLATTGGKTAFHALLRAVLFYGVSTWRTAACRYLIRLDRPQSDHGKLTLDLYEQLSAEEYASVVTWALKNVEQVFRPGSVLRQMSLLLPHPWPDQLAKILVNEFQEQLRYGRRSFAYGLATNATWKALPYRMSPTLFPWLRQQLYAAAERDDQYGNLATRMLQVLHFRREVGRG